MKCNRQRIDYAISIRPSLSASIISSIVPNNYHHKKIDGHPTTKYSEKKKVWYTKQTTAHIIFDLYFNIFYRTYCGFLLIAKSIK